VTVAAGSNPGEQARLLSRRARMRAATKEEIIQTARQLLVRDGPEAVSLRAIARTMGMTAPGLYRYFDSHEELIRHVVAAIFTELAEDIDRAMHAAVEAAEGPTPADDEADRHRDPAHLAVEMVAACREFRRWALSHTAEFSLLFGVPLPGVDDGRYDIAEECALQFGGVYFGLFQKLWESRPFPVSAPEEIDPGLRAQLDRFVAAVGLDAPIGAMLVFLRCWVLLYGAVSMEAFGHLGFALGDPSPMFEYTLSDMATLVGLRYPVPAPSPPQQP
jgi:AcrR family transcriptional regulator